MKSLFQFQRQIWARDEMSEPRRRRQRRLLRRQVRPLLQTRRPTERGTRSRNHEQVERPETALPL